MVEFSAILSALSRKLDENGIGVPMFGGFVLPVYGVERMTLDIDFMLAPEDLETFEGILSELGYRRVFKSEQYAKFRHDAPGVMDIDTVFASADSVKAIVASGTRQMIQGAAFTCVSLEILLGTKLHAIRYNEERRGHRDFDDVIELIRANHLDVAGESFQEICSKYGTQDIYNRLLAEVDHE